MNFLCEEGTWEYECVVVESDFFAAVPASESYSIHWVVNLDILNCSTWALRVNQTKTCEFSWLAWLHSCPAESIVLTRRDSSFSSFNAACNCLTDESGGGVRRFLRKLADWAVVEFNFDVRKTLLGNKTDELSLDWIEVDCFDSSDHGSYQTELSSSIEELSIVGIFKSEASQGTSSEAADINSVESLDIWSFDADEWTFRVADRWPSVGSSAVNLELSSIDWGTAVEDLGWTSCNSLDQVSAISKLGIEDWFRFVTLFLCFIIEEVHIDGVPVQYSNVNIANSIIEWVSTIAGKTELTVLLDFTALKIGEANSVVAEIIWWAFRTKTVGVDFALRVSQLTFAVGVEEVESVTVHADTVLIELPTMFISIFATSSVIESVSFFASFAGSLLDVIG